MMAMRFIFLILAGSYVMTTHCYRVVMMERKFQEIIKEFHKESATNEQDKIEKLPQEPMSINQKDGMQDHGEINHQNSLPGHDNKNEQDTFAEQSEIGAKDQIQYKRVVSNQDGRNEQDKYGITVQDSGHAESCGPPGTTMDLTWKPKIITPINGVTIELDMIAPVDFTKGQVSADLFVEGTTTPIFQYVKKISCRILGLIFSKACPKGKISKNDHIQGSRQFSSKRTIPPGTYTAVFNITNENEQLFLCAKATFIISSGNTD